MNSFHKAIEKLRFFIFAFLLVIGSGCTNSSPTLLENRAPKILNEPVKRNGSVSIAFHRLILDVPHGKKIGGYYEGLMRVKMDTYNWESTISVGSDLYNIEACRELRNYGYNVFGTENLLFGLDESAKARYLLGGTLTDIEYNTFGEHAGEFTESQVYITWELFDTLSQSVVFKHSTEGYGKACEGSEQAVYNAFKQALRRLLSDEKFIEITTENPGNHQQDKIGSLQSIDIGVEHRSLALPEDIEEVLDAVVSIKAGQTHGTGFAISQDGYILTAAHVVSGLDKVHIVTRSGQTHLAEVLKFDRCNDVALIKTNECSFHPLELELENRSPMGSEVFAVGTPICETLSWSASKGVISGHRNIDGKQCIQTDTSLNPGNSGGPLLNKYGKVVGIVGWKISATEVEGISFAVDIAIVPSVLGLTLNKKTI